MFSILRNPEATSTELAQAYVKAMTFEETLRTEQTQAKKDLVSAQLECLEKKPSKDFLSAKDRLENISSKIDAVQFGRKEIKARIAGRLQVESQERLKIIDQELESLSSEEKTLNQKYLDSAARTAVIRESIRGQALSHDSRGNYQATTPSLEIRLHLMDLKDGKIYSDRVEHYRKELQVGDFSRSIRGRESGLVEERTELEGLQGNPAEKVQKLLNKLNPPPTPEPAEPESRKTSEFTIDYDKVGPVDYGEGEPLPYKGINEVLHDRANS